MGGGRLRPASEPEWQCLQWVVGKGPKESGGAGKEGGVSVNTHCAWRWGAAGSGVEERPA